MKLWLLERTDDIGYDEYYAAVVVAETEEAARAMHCVGNYYASTAKVIGSPSGGVTGVVTESFNAG